MIKKCGALVIVLLATALLSTLVVNSNAATAQSSNALASPTLSVSNKVPDFYAEGTSGGRSLKISPKGGYLASSGPSIFLMPWGYVTAQWSIGTVYIIFLANVTENNFLVAFLYLTNSSTPFILRIFDYQDASITSLTFNGIQYVFARLTVASQTPMPQLKLVPKTKSGSDFSAIGPELYLNGNFGRLLNDSRILEIFPLKVQLFQGADDYNEVWSLLNDGSGNFYFAILYMQNSDHNRVTLEHLLRLNDYKRLDGRSLEARWISNPFTARVTVRVPLPSSTVKVDGFPFRTDGKGVLVVYVPTGSVSVEVPNDIVPTPDRRLHFSAWKNHGNANPINVDVESSLDLTANYMTQYLLTVETEYGEPQGSGWYDQDANATFTVSDSITSDNGTRRLFVRWDGDHDSTSNTGWLVMNAPKRVTATWKTQFGVNLKLVGVPANTTAHVKLNGQTQFINGSGTVVMWVDANSQLAVEVRSTQIQGITANYNFTELRVDDQAALDFNIFVKKPITVKFVYSEYPKIQSSIDVRVNPNSAIRGYPLTVTGSVPANGISTLTLFYSSDNDNWTWLANVTTRNDGTFVYDWKPDGTGTYFIKAFWPGDAQHAAASQVASVRVQEFLPNVNESNMPKFIQDAIVKARSLTAASALLGLAGSLMLLGVGIAALLVPGGSPILGYFIGSCLVGFVYVFPISAIILSVRAARRHRSPSAVWLTPLATIWIAALAMLVAGGASFAVPPMLLEASAILLISSNTLLMPLVFSLLLAKLIAS